MRELSLFSVNMLASLNKNVLYNDVKIKAKRYQCLILATLFSGSLLAIAFSAIMGLVR